MPCTCPWVHHAHARGIAMHRCMERPRAWAWYSHAQSFGETPPSLSLIRYSWTALKSDIFYMIHPCHPHIFCEFLFRFHFHHRLSNCLPFASPFRGLGRLFPRFGDWGTTAVNSVRQFKSFGSLQQASPNICSSSEKKRTC